MEVFAGGRVLSDRDQSARGLAQSKTVARDVMRSAQAEIGTADFTDDAGFGAQAWADVAPTGLGNQRERSFYKYVAPDGAGGGRAQGTW